MLLQVTMATGARKWTKLEREISLINLTNPEWYDECRVEGM